MRETVAKKYSISTAGVAKFGDKYFLAKRIPGKNMGSLWEFPGGKAENGETPAEALKREFFEEFAIDITVEDELCSGLFTNRGNIYKLVAFNISFPITLIDKITLTEHTETALATKAEFKNLCFPESDMIIVNFIMDGKG